MKGVFYGRHSTDKQDMESQVKACEEFVKKHELMLVGKYEDSAVSARKKAMYERPELKKLLTDAKNKVFDFVLIWAEDRLARKTREHREIRNIFQENNIPVYVLHNNTRYDEGEILTQTIRDSFSQYQGDKIAGDTKRAMETLVRQGKWTGGKVPYGYRYLQDSKKFVSVPEELEHVKIVYSLYKQGNLGFRAIANMMDLESRRGGLWKWYHIKEIITNPFYAGVLTLNRRDQLARQTVNKEVSEWMEHISKSIEPVITHEEWKRTWFIYKNRSDFYEGEHSPKNAGLQFTHFYLTPNVLNGLIFCSKCIKRLKCKNMTSRINGKDYGDIFYICDRCNFKVPSSKLVPISKDIWRTIQRSVDVTKISEMVYNRFQSEIEILTQSINTFEKQIKEFSINKVHYELWIEEYGRTNSEEKDIYEVFSLANSYNEKYLANANETYTRLKYKLDYLNRDKDKVIQDTERLLTTIKKDYELVPLHHLKQLLHFALDYLWIDESGNIEYAIKSELM
jgi:site-specific DNA recombinase